MQYKSLHQVTRLSKRATYCISSDIQCAHTTSLPQNAQNQSVWIFYGYRLDSERIILCLYITKRHTKLQKNYFSHHKTGTTHTVDTQGAQTHISINTRATRSMWRLVILWLCIPKCVQNFNRSLYLGVFIFLITGLIRLMLSIRRAHKHIFQSILGPHGQCK